MSTVSISKVKLFKACRRAYELKYVYDLVPVERAETLETGLSYHRKIEELYRTGDVDTSDLSRESAMAKAYEKYIYPRFKVRSVEDWFEFLLPNGDKLVGRTDGITEDGDLVEHKTTSQEIGEDYEYGLTCWRRIQEKYFIRSVESPQSGRRKANLMKSFSIAWLPGTMMTQMQRSGC